MDQYLIFIYKLIYLKITIIRYFLKIRGRYMFFLNTFLGQNKLKSKEFCFELTIFFFKNNLKYNYQTH